MPTDLLATVRRLAFSAGEARRFTARAWLVAPAVQASLALAGLARTLRWIEAIPPRRRARAHRVGVEAGERHVGDAYRAHFVGGACLSRSLTQYLLHRRDGEPVRVVVGVRRASRALAAHAWVEHREAAPRTESGFQRLFTSPAERAAP